VKRRTFVVGSLATPLLLGFARPEALSVREAIFEEMGTSLVVTVQLPGLFKKHDTDALASIDSGFDTNLHFSLKVWEWGKRKLVAQRTVLVKIRRDPWKKMYVVSTRGSRGWSKRFFEKRDEAIAAATTLTRATVASTSELERGDDGPYYFVEILAQRNPLASDARRKRGATGRGTGRDLEWFGRLVEVLAGERAKAEETVHVRTNPTYLVPQ
jgi:hypothetical protein